MIGAIKYLLGIFKGDLLTTLSSSMTSFYDNPDNIKSLPKISDSEKYAAAKHEDQKWNRYVLI